MATTQMTQKSFTIPLRKEFQQSAPLRRTPRAVKAVKAYLKRHCKVDDVRLGARLNESLWVRGVRHPPARVSVDVSVEDGVAKAELQGFEYVEAARPQAKQEPESFKDKMASKLGAAKGAKAGEESSSEKPEGSPDGAEKPAKEQESSEADEKESSGNQDSEDSQEKKSDS
ncbi:MAG: hypothetical protein ACLFO2_05060 [Candidatus Woesearchaeota archaeon]